MRALKTPFNYFLIQASCKSLLVPVQREASFRNSPNVYQGLRGAVYCSGRVTGKNKLLVGHSALLRAVVRHFHGSYALNLVCSTSLRLLTLCPAVQQTKPLPSCKLEQHAGRSKRVALLLLYRGGLRTRLNKWGPGPGWSLSSVPHLGAGADIEQPSVSWSQTRKRSGSQQFREQPFGCAAHSQREQRQVAWCLWGCKWKPRIPRTGMLCKLLALMVGLLVVFHAASCGYFFCVQFPGARVLDFSRDIYDDFRDIYALSGMTSFPCLNRPPRKPVINAPLILKRKT